MQIMEDFLEGTLRINLIDVSIVIFLLLKVFKL
jgi:hypothetical protein